MERGKKHTVFSRITDGTVKKIRKFRNNTKGVTTVEVILVLVVLLAIVVIFREQLTVILAFSCNLFIIHTIHLLYYLHD